MCFFLILILVCVLIILIVFISILIVLIVLIFTSLTGIVKFVDRLGLKGFGNDCEGGLALSSVLGGLGEGHESINYVFIDNIFLFRTLHGHEVDSLAGKS